VGAAPGAGSVAAWSTTVQPPSCSSISYRVINGLSLCHFQFNAYRIVVNGYARPSRSPPGVFKDDERQLKYLSCEVVVIALSNGARRDRTGKKHGAARLTRQRVLPIGSGLRRLPQISIPCGSPPCVQVGNVGTLVIQWHRERAQYQAAGGGERCSLGLRKVNVQGRGSLGW
jgi:hypothetical protein